MYYPQQWDVPTYCTCYLVLQNSIQILFTPSLFQHVFSECPLYAQHSITVLLTQGSKSSHQRFLFQSSGDAFRITGEGNGSPLQYSCLANPVDRGAWQAAVHGVVASVAAVERQAAGLQFAPLSPRLSVASISRFLSSNPVSSKQQDAGVPVHLLPWGQLVVVISLRELIKTV